MFKNIFSFRLSWEGNVTNQGRGTDASRPWAEQDHSFRAPGASAWRFNDPFRLCLSGRTVISRARQPN
jgi:hypothetical protein